MFSPIMSSARASHDFKANNAPRLLQVMHKLALAIPLALTVNGSLSIAEAKPSQTFPLNGTEQSTALSGALGNTLSGNFLAGIVAGADHDTKTAELYLTQALRDDPTNANLLNQIFLTALTNGDIVKANLLAKPLLHQPACPIWLRISMMTLSEY